MKKKELISSISALAVLTLASCGEAVKEGLNRRAVDNAANAVDAQKWTPVCKTMA